MSDVANWNSQFGLHRAYLDDDVRNRAFHRAIVEHVRPGSRVLDLGSGTGIWACVAARAGAARVVAVEFSDLAEQARRTAECNGVAGVVEVIRQDIRTLDLAREFDVIIHELVGGLVWEEDMVELTALARDRFLRPDGILFPAEVRVWMAPWQLADRPRRNQWPTVCGLDFAHLHDADLAKWRAERRATCLHRVDPEGALGAPVHVHTSRLGLDREPLPRALRFTVTAERDAVATGILAFMEIDLGGGLSGGLGGGNVIHTSPFCPPTSWGQLYIPAVEPIQLERGGRYEVEVAPSMLPRGWAIEWSAVHPRRDFFHDR